MKIAVISSGGLDIPMVGGSIRKYAFSPAKGLCLLDHEVHFFEPANSRLNKLDTDLPNLHIHKVAYPNFQFVRFANPLLAAMGIHLNMIAFSISLFFKLMKLIRKEKFDIIHVNTRYDAVAVILLQKVMSSSIPVIFTCHTSDWQRDRLPLFHRFFFLPEVFTIKRSAAVVTVGKTQRDGILRRISVSPDKIKVVHPGIDKSLFKPETDNDSAGTHILCVSDISPRKNQLTLVKAMPEILSRFPECKLVLVGGLRDNGYLSDINRLSEQSGISGSIDIRGKVSSEELLDWIHRAAICVIPTHMEGFTSVLLEMLSCKKAVIASRIPEITELNTMAGRDIFATASPDEPGEWAAEIIELLSDDEKRHEYESNADTMVFDNVWEASQYVQVYEEAMTVSGDKRENNKAAERDS